MANNEDYLDSLLNSISKVKDDINKEEESTVKRASSLSATPKMSSDDDFLSANGIDPFEADPFDGIIKEKRKEYSDLDFLKEFEQELLSGEADRFLRDFETELDEEEGEDGSELSDDSLMDSIEGIVSVAKKQANAQMAGDLSEAMEAAKIETESESLDMDLTGLDDLGSLGDLGDLSLEEPSSDDELLDDNNIESEEGDLSLDSGLDLSFGDGEENALLDENADIDLDELALGDEDLADINEMMNADALGEAIEGVGDELDENTRRSIEGEDTAEVDAPKKGFKGFLAKLKTIIFGDDDEEDEDAPSLDNMSDEDLEGLSEEQLEIMRNLAGGSPEEAAEDGGKKKKKKEKKEKPPKEKKEKAPKPPKEPKPKKEKPPKEKDNTPPLPKAMIIIPVILLGSVLALIIGGTNILSHGLAVSGAKKSIEIGEYLEAYSSLEGIEIKNEEEEALWMKTQILAAVEYEIDCYHDFMELQKYDMALDSLICGLGRAKANSANADFYAVGDRLNVMKKEISESLMTQFNVTEEEALEIYALRRRTEYTHRLYDFLERAGIPY